MRIEELSIGDWVEVDGEFTDVTGINRTEINTSCIKEVDIRKVKPIRITPEVLEDNGFNKINSKEYSFEIVNKNIETRIEIETDCCIFSFIYVYRFVNGFRLKVFGLNINYIHEFQHALRLCKIDKEIEL